MLLVILYCRSREISRYANSIIPLVSTINHILSGYTVLKDTSSTLGSPRIRFVSTNDDEMEISVFKWLNWANNLPFRPNRRTEWLLARQEIFTSAREVNTDIRRLTTGIRSEKCVVRWFRLCVNVIECTYTNPDSIAYYRYASLDDGDTFLEMRR